MNKLSIYRQTCFLLVTLVLLTVSTKVQGMEITYGRHPDKERVVFTFPQSIAFYRAARVDKNEIFVGMPRPALQKAASLPPLEASSLIKELIPTTGGIRIITSTSAFGFVAFNLDNRQRIVIDVFSDPIGQRWQAQKKAVLLPQEKSTQQAFSRQKTIPSEPKKEMKNPIPAPVLPGLNIMELNTESAVPPVQSSVLAPTKKPVATTLPQTKIKSALNQKPEKKAVVQKNLPFRPEKKADYSLIPMQEGGFQGKVNFTTVRPVEPLPVLEPQKRKPAGKKDIQNVEDLLKGKEKKNVFHYGLLTPVKSSSQTEKVQKHMNEAGKQKTDISPMPLPALKKPQEWNLQQTKIPSEPEEEAVKQREAYLKKLLNDALLAQSLQDYNKVLETCALFEKKFSATPLALRAKEVGKKALERLLHMLATNENYPKIISIWDKYGPKYTEKEALMPQATLAVAQALWKQGRTDEALKMSLPFIYREQMPQYSEMALGLSLSILLDHGSWKQILCLRQATANWRLSPYYIKELKFAEALSLENIGFIDESAELWVRIGEDHSFQRKQRGCAMLFLAKHALNNQQTAKAYELAKGAYKLLQDADNQDKRNLREATELLIEITERSGRYQEAIKWADIYSTLLPENDPGKEFITYRKAGLYLKGGDSATWREILIKLAEKGQGSLYARQAASDLINEDLLRKANKYARPNGL